MDEFKYIEPLSFQVEKIDNGYLVTHNITGTFKKQFKQTRDEVFELLVQNFHPFFEKQENHTNNVQP